MRVNVICMDRRNIGLNWCTTCGCARQKQGYILSYSNPPKLKIPYHGYLNKNTVLPVIGYSNILKYRTVAIDPIQFRENLRW